VAIVACGGDSITSSTAPSTLPSTDTQATTSVTSMPTDVTTTVAPTTIPTAPPTTTAPTTTAPTATAPTTTLEAPMTSVPDSPVPAEVIAGDMVQTAIDDLVERTGADRNAIEVVSVEEVDWPDGSIGCPRPGMVYTQAIVNGSKIVLRYDGMTHHYHQGGSRAVFYCPPQYVQPAAGDTRDPDR
jgi:hypothetical protein